MDIFILLSGKQCHSASHSLRKICSLRPNEGFHKLPYKHYCHSPSALKYLEMKGENGNVLFFKNIHLKGHY